MSSRPHCHSRTTASACTSIARAAQRAPDARRSPRAEEAEGAVLRRDDRRCAPRLPAGGQCSRAISASSYAARGHAQPAGTTIARSASGAAQRRAADRRPPTPRTERDVGVAGEGERLRDGADRRRTDGDDQRVVGQGLPARQHRHVARRARPPRAGPPRATPPARGRRRRRAGGRYRWPSPKARPVAVAGILNRCTGSIRLTVGRVPANARSASAASMPAMPAPAIRTRTGWRGVDAHDEHRPVEAGVHRSSVPSQCGFPHLPAGPAVPLQGPVWARARGWSTGGPRARIDGDVGSTSRWTRSIVTGLARARRTPPGDARLPADLGRGASALVGTAGRLEVAERALVRD